MQDIDPFMKELFPTKPKYQMISEDVTKRTPWTLNRASDIPRTENKYFIDIYLHNGGGMTDM